MVATDTQTMPAFGALKPPAVLLRVLGVSNLDQPHPVSGLRRKIAKRLLRRTSWVFDVTYRGLKLRLMPSDNAGDLMIAMHGKHNEEDELDIFDTQIAEASVFVDIGANIGLYSLAAARLMTDNATILSFEPSPTTSARLATNVALNAAGAQVTIIQAGVGPNPGTLPLARNKSYNAGSASLVASGKGSANKVNVPIVTLLGELTKRGITSVDVLKIDIEGFEDQALYPFFRDAPEALWPRYLLLETCHADQWANDLLAKLDACGYRVAFENKNNRHYERGSQ